MLVPRAPSLLREKDSNLRPCGYEPRELPLLYPAICCKSQELNLIKSAYETDEIPYLPTAVYYLLRSMRESNSHLYRDRVAS